VCRSQIQKKSLKSAALKALYVSSVTFKLVDAEVLLCPVARISQLGGPKNQKGGPHFLKKILDVRSNRGANMKWGRTDFKLGSLSPLAPPLSTALVLVPFDVVSLFSKVPASVAMAIFKQRLLACDDLA